MRVSLPDPTHPKAPSSAISPQLLVLSDGSDSSRQLAHILGLSPRRLAFEAVYNRILGHDGRGSPVPDSR